MEKTLKELARLVNGECRGPEDLAIKGLAALDQAGPQEITFVTRSSGATSNGKSTLSLVGSVTREGDP